MVRIESSQSDVRVPRRRIGDLVDFVRRAERVAIAEVDVAVVSADEIAMLNRRYLRHAGPTDVLSFDLSDETTTGLRAQIVVCGRVAREQSTAHGTGVHYELLLYVAHGLLHLLGYDDQSVRAAARMRARQEQLLRAYLAGDDPGGLAPAE